MKHQPDVATARWMSRHDRRPRREPSFPRIACEFQARRFGNSFDGSDLPQRRPYFTRLAREVLQADARRRFRRESAVLGLVTLSCAWPMAIMIHEVYLILR